MVLTMWLLALHVLASCSESTSASPVAPSAALTAAAAASLPRRQVGQNRLTGVIPASWTTGGLSSLADLDVSANQLSGILPPGLSKLSGLQTLRAGSNKFSGGLPCPSRNACGFGSSYRAPTCRPHRFSDTTSQEGLARIG